MIIYSNEEKNEREREKKRITIKISTVFHITNDVVLVIPNQFTLQLYV